MRRRLRALIVTTNWPTPESPVNGVFVREHARAVAEHVDVAVVFLERAPSRRGVAELVPLGDAPPPAWRYRYRRLGPPASYVAFALGPFEAYRRLSRAGFDPDVIHAQSFLSALPALALGRLARKPVAYTEHWTIFLRENPGTLSPAMERLARLALRRADVVLPVSEDLRAALARLAPEARFRVVPNVVDERVFRPRDGRTDGGPPRLLTAGLLDTERKGLDILLEALSRVESPFLLDVVGDGARRPDYERLAARLGLDERVRFHGLKRREEVAEAMRGSDLFVLGSRFENNPCVLIEAMATGLPIVATAVGGVAEVVDAEAGLLAAPLDPGDLAAKIGAALSRLDSFDRAAISRRAVERYGRDRIGRELAEVYAGLVRRA